MELFKQSVGIDVSKDTICAQILQNTKDLDIINKGYAVFDNKLSGFKDLIQWVTDNVEQDIITHYTMETTGIYHEKLAHYLHQKGKNVHIVTAYVVKRYADSLNVKSKTDKLDAKSIATLALERKLPEWTPKQELYLCLRNLTREREMIQKAKTICKNQIHALKHSYKAYYKTKNRLTNRIKYLDKQLKSIDNDLIKIVQKCPDLDRKIEQICTIPGVGFTTVVTVLAETDGFVDIRNKRQLTSYAGLDIRLKESGKYKGQTKISKRGNAHLRKALYMPSLSVIQYAEKYKQFYTQLCTRKDKPMIALIAVQRKMLMLIYALWKKDEPYIDNYAKS